MSGGIPFEAINKAALAGFEGLLREWFPHGKRIGDEFAVGDLRGTPGQSVRINIRSGKWAEFNGGPSGNDPISLYAAYRGCRQGEAAKELGAKFGVFMNGHAAAEPKREQPKAKPAGEGGTWEPILPPPPDAPDPTPHFRGYNTTYPYPDASYRTLFYVRRREASGGGKKLFHPLTYGRLNGELGWHHKHPADPRPLFGLCYLAHHPQAPVLICEGEKAADATTDPKRPDLVALFRDWVCVSWPGGTEAAHKADWTPLKGRRVVIWPDADEPGRKAARKLVGLLRNAGVAEVRVVDVPQSWREGWDLADEPPEGADLAQMLANATVPAEEPEKPAPDTSQLDGFELNEDGIALAFTAKYRDELRFCHHAGKWYRWDGCIWRLEETKLAFSWARAICRQLARESDAEDRLRTTLAKAATAAAVERYAQADEQHAVTSAIWDTDPLLLGTPGGTVDLRTGELRPARQCDYITKTAAIAPAPAADCPLWLRFLDEACGQDGGLVRFLKQFCGYLLTGDTREHALLFGYGPGGNGKTVWLNTVSGILGDYARIAAMETFTQAQFDRHPTELAMLKGARMVCASETEEGRAWAEVRIKQLTGGDTICARFMRRDFFEYRPQFKLVVIGNHKPTLHNVDDAARRRFNVVPFINKPVTPDRELEQKLRAEWPAILRWMIEGCLDWQANGLVRPQVVLDATRDYFDEQDLLRQWIEECCDFGDPRLSETNKRLFKSWSDYAIASGEKPRPSKWLTQALMRQGCRPLRHVEGHHGQRGLSHIAVRNVDTSDQWQNRMDADDPPPF